MHQLRRALAPAFLFLCLTLGGASAAGIWSNMLLQILAIPIIVAAVLSTRSTPVARPSRQLVALFLLMVGVIALQLIPLPPQIWSTLPGRAAIAEGFAMVGRETPWLTLSLSPYRTISSTLWLLPAIAVLLAVLRLGAYKPGWLAWVVVGLTVISVTLGALQVAGASGWYFYHITNYGASTGFFANANHLATLLVCTIPFLTALYLQGRSKGDSMQRNSGLLVILVVSIGVVFVGIAVNGSLAGVGLSVPVLAASALMILSRRGRRMPRWLLALVPLLLVGSVIAVLNAPLGNNLVGDEARSTEDSRLTFFSRSLNAAADFAPAGSGIGTFQEIYRSHEDPATISRFFTNHVHNDYIELALEVGAPGMIVLALFLLWWVKRLRAIWRAEARDVFALAASIASGTILVHSFVDYPLRTGGLSALFAVCVALMAEPRPHGRARQDEREDDGSERAGARHLSAD